MYSFRQSMVLLIVFSIGSIWAKDNRPVLPSKYSIKKCNPSVDVSLIRRTLDDCAFAKWTPPPKQDYTDQRECCFQMERTCLDDKTFRTHCEVDKDFDDAISRDYGNITYQCSNAGHDFSTDFCSKLSTNPVNDKTCLQYMPCNCSTSSTLADISDDERKCAINYWHPIKGQYDLDDRTCCYHYMDYFCLHNKTTRMHCNVGQEYDKRLQARFDILTNECSVKAGITVNEQLCSQVKANPSMDDRCSKYETCHPMPSPGQPKPPAVVSDSPTGDPNKPEDSEQTSKSFSVYDKSLLLLSILLFILRNIIH